MWILGLLTNHPSLLLFLHSHSWYSNVCLIFCTSGIMTCVLCVGCYVLKCFLSNSLHSQWDIQEGIAKIFKGSTSRKNKWFQAFGNISFDLFLCAIPWWFPTSRLGIVSLDYWEHRLQSISASAFLDWYKAYFLSPLVGSQVIQTCVFRCRHLISNIPMNVSRE